jgi:selenide,water dikinase
MIAAANALSDIYAMGGVPKTAMNLVAFPLKTMDITILRRVLEGGLDKLKEAGVVLVGGHSVEDNELKYGLSVTGFVHPDRVLTKQGLIAGDRLILTKPLGVGIINTAIKGGVAAAEVIEAVTALMATLNRKAAQVMTDFAVHACTDITGFGLLGHMAEMIVGTGHGVALDVGQIPIIKEAREYAGMGLVPGGTHNNREFRKDMIDFSAGLDAVIWDILFDPQTSGGLLIAVAPEQSAALIERLRDNGIARAAVIGEVIADAGEKITAA